MIVKRTVNMIEMMRIMIAKKTVMRMGGECSRTRDVVLRGPSGGDRLQLGEATRAAQTEFGIDTVSHSIEFVLR
jgi:hypothetical protein